MIEFKLSDRNKVLMICESESESKPILSTFTKREKVKVYQYWNKTYKTEEQDVLYLDWDEETLTFTIQLGLVPMMKELVIQSGILFKIDQSITDKLYSNTLIIEDEWYEMFENHPKKDLGYDVLQYEAAKGVESTNLGLITLPTGVGKGNIIGAIVSSFLNTREGMVVIASYTNQVLAELELRVKSLGMGEDIEKRIFFMNPAGMARSDLTKRKYGDFTYQEILDSTKLLIFDEAHHIRAPTWDELYSAVDWDYCYGMTATADPISNSPIDLDHLKSRNLSNTSFCCASVFGKSLVFDTLAVDLDLITITTEIVTKAQVDKFMTLNPNSSMYLPTVTTTTDEFALLIKAISDNFIDENKILFVPETFKVDTATQLSTNLGKFGVTNIFMSGQHIWSHVGELDIDLEGIKGLAANSSFKVFLANSAAVEGVDIPNLDSMVALSGTNFKTYLQPLGRSARAHRVKCFFIYDRHNYMLNHQTKRRFQLTKTLNVVSKSNYVANFSHEDGNVSSVSLLKVDK